MEAIHTSVGDDGERLIKISFSTIDGKQPPSELPAALRLEVGAHLKQLLSRWKVLQKEADAGAR